MTGQITEEVKSNKTKGSITILCLYKWWKKFRYESNPM